MFNNKIKNICLCVICFFIIFNNNEVTSKETECKEKKEVCAWLKKVVAIKTPTMVASGVMISKNLILTNKHVVEDSKSLLVRTQDNKIIKAIPIPNNHMADIVLISIGENSYKKIIFDAKTSNKVRIVAFDIGRNAIRIFPKANLISEPEKSNPQAKIHSTAQNLPGTSGGALIDENGNLIGIVASGGSQYNEAVPIYLYNEIIQGKVNENNFFERGKYFRLCADTLEEIKVIQDKNTIKKLIRNCEETKNKLFFDLTGQELGKLGILNESLYFLNKSVNLDPKSPTSLHSLAVTLHLNRSYVKEITILKTLLKYTPDDPQALRLAIQAAGFTKNKEFADFTLKLMEKHNPAAIPLAKGFLDNIFN